MVVNDFIWGVHKRLKRMILPRLHQTICPLDKSGRPSCPHHNMGRGAAFKKDKNARKTTEIHVKTA